MAVTGLLYLAEPVCAAEAESQDGSGSIDLFDTDVEKTDTNWSRFNISLGWMYLDADGVLGARPPASPPITIIDFDRIGLDEKDASHWLSAIWRARESRWGIWFANWRYDVNGSRNFGDGLALPQGEAIPAGARVESSFDAEWYILEATYSIVQQESIDVGIGFGFHTVNLETDLRAEVDIGGGSIEIVNGDLDTLAPLPNVFAFTYWKFLPRWDLIARVGWFGLDYDKYNGRMTNAHLMLQYLVSRRIELGAGYQFVRLDLDIERKRYQEIYDIDFYGPMLFARFRF